MKYLVFFTADREYLDSVAEHKAEAEKSLGQIKKLGMPGRIMPAHEFFRGCESVDVRICKVLSLLGLQEDGYSRNGNVFSVKIEGSAKYDHEFCDTILSRLFGCRILHGEFSYNVPADRYEATHLYCLREPRTIKGGN